MALVLADRVRETTTVTGTGTATLLGAVSGYQSFSAVGNANTTYYVIANQSATEWEVGIGTYTSAGTTLSRTTVLSSSNSGSLVNFSAGTKDVFVDYPASKAVYENAAGNVDGYPITGGTIDNTTIGATTPSTGVFTTLTATGNITYFGGVSGSDVVRIYKNNTITSDTASFSAPALSFIPPQTGYGAGILRANGQFNITTSGVQSINLQTNAATLGYAGTTQAVIANTASAVNYVQVTGAATGVGPTLSTQGSDANTTLNVIAKGSGLINLGANGNPYVLQVQGTASGANYNSWRVAGGAGGSGASSAPVFSTWGIDTNISAVFQSKGTGAIDLAAGSSGVNISNGGTVTAITRTATGSSYTSFPSISITAPTTAGGVQATASTATMFATGATVVAGGTGYTLNDVVTLSGGTPQTVGATYTVTSVSAGVVTAVTPLNYAIYTALPTNPVSVTGGTGSGLTLTVLWNWNSATITNAGSGYVEQPTVTFSGGGGSGAAAYATVGSASKITSLFSFLPIYGPSGTVASFQGSTNTSANYVQLGSQSTGNYPSISAQGSDTNVGFDIFSKGTGPIRSRTGSSGVTQLQVADTASAVNYVQVTGSATGGRVTISAQGSDANVPLVIGTKGSGSLNVRTNDSVTTQFAVTSTASAVNYINVTGGVASSAPTISALGTDTNIDLALTTKGTGRVKFGTYTANMALTIQGYIEILDSGGTIRKLAVIA